MLLAIVTCYALSHNLLWLWNFMRFFHSRLYAFYFDRVVTIVIVVVFAFLNSNYESKRTSLLVFIYFIFATASCLLAFNDCFYFTITVWHYFCSFCATYAVIFGFIWDVTLFVLVWYTSLKISLPNKQQIKRKQKKLAFISILMIQLYFFLSFF